MEGEPGPRWGLSEPIVGWFAGAIAALLGGIAGSLVTGDGITLGTVIGGFVGMWGAYVFAIVLTSRARGSGDPARDIGLRFEGGQVVAGGLLAGVVTSLLVVNAIYLFLQFAGALDSEDLNRLDAPAEELTNLAQGPAFFVLAVLVGVGAPLVEEAFFRGLLQPAFVRRTGAVAGVVLTAAFFAAAHFQPLQFPALFAFGLVVGTLAYRTKRLGPSIAAHVAFNGLTLIVLATR